ncbi:MAG: flagellar basal body P-ring protein FlgI [bacterium]|nr:flagellar basal body P-ring protein FlgI [bacterium]
MKRLIFLVVLVATMVFSVPSVKIGDLVDIQGMRPNHLVGYGLIVGLDGTGDSKGTFFTAQSIVNLLAHFGIAVEKDKMKVKNIAAVLVTCEIPAFTRVGMKVDVTVSSIGDSKNLQGGILLQTPLLGADGLVYVTAQGPISTGGPITAGGRMAHPTVARIDNGGLVEREVISELSNQVISLCLKEPSFSLASNIAQSINTYFEKDIAKPIDPSLIEIKIPNGFKDNPVSFFSSIQSIYISPEQKAKVVINERTGTIVMGENIKISACAISHGNLSISVAEEGVAGKKQTKQERVLLLKEGASVKDVVASLNAVGARPADVIAILSAMKASGALYAEIVIM